MTFSIAAVIPTWCEARTIRAIVETCRRVADEVIVSDAASPDATATLALEAGAHVVSSRRGRGPQLNAGAVAATADVLLFVHADTTLPPAARPAIRSALLDPGVVGGNFKLRFVPQTRSARIYSLANDLRRRFLRVYYGDSCIFVRRSAFLELGGFAQIPLFEDHEFVRRLERHGRTQYVADVEVESSARRFAARPLRTLTLWSALQVAYSLGVPAEQLARYYAAMR